MYSFHRRSPDRPARRSVSLVVVGVVLALAFAMPAFGGPSALSIAKKALKTANKALTTAKKPVGSGKLVDGAVINSKIADGAVGPAKLANGAVINAKIADDAVGPAKLANGAVINAKIADGAVGPAKIADNAVDGSKVAPESLSTDDLVGADVKGPFNVSAGATTSGNCAFFDAGITGAKQGQVPLFSLQAGAVLNNSWIISALKVPLDGQVTMRFCWIGAGSSPAIVDLPVRIITFG